MAAVRPHLFSRWTRPDSGCCPQAVIDFAFLCLAVANSLMINEVSALTLAVHLRSQKLC